jgi:type 1 glutamine amidotransferase
MHPLDSAYRNSMNAARMLFFTAVFVSLFALAGEPKQLKALWFSGGGYGKGRVFAATTGHDLHTVQSPDYVLLLTRGLLWACGGLDTTVQ